MEHRWGQREQIDLPIHITGTTCDTIAGRLSDLSLSGAFIEVDMDVRVLCRLHVATIVPRPLAPNTVSLYAHVIRKEYRGVGVEWSSFAPATYRALIDLASRRRDSRKRPAGSRPHWVNVPGNEEVAATSPLVDERLRSGDAWRAPTTHAELITRVC
jgi:PilZ domain